MKQKFIFLILYLVLSSSYAVVYANTFGESCSALPIVDSTNYLINDTAYGFIQKNIDMKTHVDGACDPVGEEFKFCVRNSAGSSDVCTPITMNIGDTVAFGSITTNPEFLSNSSIRDVVLKIEVIESEVCLTMPTSRGVMPILCRDKEVTGATTAAVEEVCKTLGQSCYDGRNKSQSLLSFSGLTIHCLRDTLNKVFYVGNACPTFDGDGITFAALRPFPEFQEGIKLVVKGALILYVMVFGFKIVMNAEYAQLNKIAIFIIQFILVVYFSVGLGAKKIENGKEVQPSGMTEFALPMLLEMTSNFTEYMFLAGGSQGLCDFDKSKYETGYEFYKAWDAIDCRIGYYLGMQLLYNIGSILEPLNSTTASNADNSSINWGAKGNNGIDALKEVGSLTFFQVMFGFFMAGNILIVIMGVVFAVVFISVLMYFIGAYMVCLVTLYVIAYIAPVFIPMALFERTKGYFDSWLKILVSCALQPVIIGGFIALLLTMYDSAIYGNCEFQRHDYSIDGFNFSTFELRLPSVEAEKCEASAGYKLVKYSLGQWWETRILMLFEVHKINDYLNISLSLLYTMVYVVIFYFFIENVNEFISDLVGGPSLSSVTVNPNMIVDKVRNMATAAVLAIMAAIKAKAGDTEGAASDAAEALDKGSEDTSSNQRKGVSDSASNSQTSGGGDSGGAGGSDGSGGSSSGDSGSKGGK